MYTMRGIHPRHTTLLLLIVNYCYHDYGHDVVYCFGFLMLHPGLGLWQD